jgi:lysozyme family protein
MDWKEFDAIGWDLMFQTLTIAPEKLADAKTKAYSMMMGEQKEYAEVAAATGIPWYVVGAIHIMECGSNFYRHLHNGDPLTGRTIHVPAGRPVPPPKSGEFPYTWVESACDALSSGYPKKPTVWDTAHCLNFLEEYNGLGYRNRSLASPYIWAATNNYTRGKFTADGKFDPNAESTQIGCAAILKLLSDWKMITLV